MATVHTCAPFQHLSHRIADRCGFFGVNDRLSLTGGRGSISLEHHGSIDAPNDIPAGGHWRCERSSRTDLIVEEDVSVTRVFLYSMYVERGKA